MASFGLRVLSLPASVRPSVCLFVCLCTRASITSLSEPLTYRKWHMLETLVYCHFRVWKSPYTTKFRTHILENVIHRHDFWWEKFGVQNLHFHLICEWIPTIYISNCRLMETENTHPDFHNQGCSNVQAFYKFLWGRVVNWWHLVDYDICHTWQSFRQWALFGMTRASSQIHQCIGQISHSAPFCDRNVHISFTK